MLRKDGKKEDRRQYNHPMRGRCDCGKFLSDIKGRTQYNNLDFDDFLPPFPTFIVTGICKIHGKVECKDHEFSPEDFGFED
jgi:hypothetical protein